MLNSRFFYFLLVVCLHALYALFGQVCLQVNSQAFRAFNHISLSCWLVHVNRWLYMGWESNLCLCPPRSLSGCPLTPGWWALPSFQHVVNGCGLVFRQAMLSVSIVHSVSCPGSLLFHWCSDLIHHSNLHHGAGDFQSVLREMLRCLMVCGECWLLVTWRLARCSDSPAM